MSERAPQWRRADESDWGLGRFDVREILRLAASGLRDNARGLWVAATRGRTMAAIEASGEELRVALGSGTTPPDGWVGLDFHRKGDNVYKADLRMPLPLRDASVSAVLAEHVLEHLFYDELEPLMAELWRVIRPGGVLRVVSPDACAIARLVLAGPEARHTAEVEYDRGIHRWPDDGLAWARSINRVSHQWGQHKSLLSAAMLEPLLEAAGFADIVAPEPGTSAYLPQVPDVHPRRFPDEPAGVNFVLEARKGG